MESFLIGFEQHYGTRKFTQPAIIKFKMLTYITKHKRASLRNGDVYYCRQEIALSLKDQVHCIYILTHAVDMTNNNLA